MSENGNLVSIFIAPSASAPMVEVPEAQLTAGRGIEGDRYFIRCGTYSATPGTGREVTLIEAEALEAAARDYRLSIPAAQTRRNLLVRGLYLNHLVGHELSVGGVRLRGVRLCEPCGHFEKLCGIAGARVAFVHRGGLRCAIVEGGVIRRGDPVVPQPGPRS
jgi:MOSC domain-containing protein YiiM